MRRSLGSVLCVVLIFVLCPAGMAQGPAANASWDACLKAPTRTCLLDETLIKALSVEPSAGSAVQLRRIVEAYAAAGDIQTALKVAHSIPSDEAPRAAALVSIAGAQTRTGLAGEAKETLGEARRLARSLKDRLQAAALLQSVGQAYADAGMAEAMDAFLESVKLAESVVMPANSGCFVSSPERRLDALRERLAEEQARAGNIADSLHTVRSIRYDFAAQAAALRAIAEMPTRAGRRGEAGPILREALAAAFMHMSQTPQLEQLPSCPNVRQAASSAARYVESLCDIAKAQTKAGLNDDAAATFEEALQFIPDIKDDVFLKADFTKANAMSAVAKAQNDAGFKAQSAEIFERAMEAAMGVSEPMSRIMALNELGGAQYQAGRIAEAMRTFDDALALARGAENGGVRHYRMTVVLSARVAAGVMADTEAILAQILEAARSTSNYSLLRRIASVQENMGHHEDAVATYRDALDALDTIAKKWKKWPRDNEVVGLILAEPGILAQPGLIPESAQQAVRMAQSIEDPLRRSEVLVAIAGVLQSN